MLKRNNIKVSVANIYKACAPSSLDYVLKKQRLHHKQQNRHWYYLTYHKPTATPTATPALCQLEETNNKRGQRKSKTVFINIL